MCVCCVAEKSLCVPCAEVLGLGHLVTWGGGMFFTGSYDGAPVVFEGCNKKEEQSLTNSGCLKIPT